ncbi:MAG: hypothetical protein EWV58_09875 [Microcystis aeruginosa Ma_MB_F_20061100_S19]|nr:MAG: hypothetical protein EWV58_09875 [Microcystis aeruginosa Ma_MB_F_20061100_S19]TRU16904.1 MAG: hypothetical protein EWV59_01150 [Microcystis aeruginosa Ma_MB_F_20061100_S19D]
MISDQSSVREVGSGEKQSITGFLKFDWESIILSRWVLKIVSSPLIKGGLRGDKRQNLSSIYLLNRP